MNRLSIIGIGLLATGTLAGGALAAGPSKTDMDFCNQKAAQVSKASPVQPGTKDSASAPKDNTGGPVAPGTAARPQPGSPQGANPTGGRNTYSGRATIAASQIGQAPPCETDPAHGQAHLSGAATTRPVKSQRHPP